MVPRVAGRQVDDHPPDPPRLRRAAPVHACCPPSRPLSCAASPRRWCGHGSPTSPPPGSPPARITKAMHLLRSSLGQAVADEILVRNPAAQISVARARRRDQLFLAVEQVSAGAEAAESRQDPRRSPRSLAGLHRGMRWGEPPALRRPQSTSRRRRVRITEAISTGRWTTRGWGHQDPRSADDHDAGVPRRPGRRPPRRRGAGRGWSSPPPQGGSLRVIELATTGLGAALVTPASTLGCVSTTCGTPRRA